MAEERLVRGRGRARVRVRVRVRVRDRDRDRDRVRVLAHPIPMLGAYLPYISPDPDARCAA